MLRITLADSGNHHAILRLEGRVAGPWVTELWKACEKVLGEGQALELNLADVSFLDPALASFHLPAFVAYGVYIGEVVAPLFVIVGAWTRIASLVVVFNMIMAILLEAHRNVAVIQRTGAWGLEAEAFYLLTALVIALIGPGKYALVRERRALA